MVTTGSYSDYSVRGVFTTRDGAEMLAAKYPPHYAEIEEITLDEYPDYPAGMLRYRVYFDIDGNSWATHCEPDIGDDSNSKCYPGASGKTMATYCWARDEDHAVKIANERRAQVIASGRWATTWDEYYRLNPVG
jgi:hypothetical protein